MLAVVTGASGLLGGNLAIELLRQGHRVRATRRGQSRVGHLDELAIEWRTADLADADALAAAFDGADWVFHCAAQVSIVRRVTPALREANVEGTRRVIEAMRRAGAGRLIHCSTVGAIGLSENGLPSDETATFNFDRHGLDDGYVVTKHQAEEVVRRAVAEGLDAVIANPTFMLGPYDARPSSGELIVAVARGRAPGWPGGSNNFVDVRDVARGMIRVAEAGRRGERYILGGENLPYREVLARIARELGVRPPRFPVPPWLSRAVGWGGDLVEHLTGRESKINSIKAAWGECTRFIFTSDKARRELGYTTGPLEVAIRDAVAWFRAQGMLR